MSGRLTTRLTSAYAAEGRRNAARWLRGCEGADDAVVRGRRPTVELDGHIRIGRRFHLESSPVASHLVTGPGATLEIGDDVHIGHGAAIAAFTGVTIGDGTCIGPLLILMDTDFHAVGSRALSFRGKPVTIGRNVRIGSRVTILRGTTVHDGAELVAGAVVSGVVPAGARMAGVPAQQVGQAAP